MMVTPCSMLAAIRSLNFPSPQPYWSSLTLLAPFLYLKVPGTLPRILPCDRCKAASETVPGGSYGEREPRPISIMVKGLSPKEEGRLCGQSCKPFHCVKLKRTQLICFSLSRPSAAWGVQSLNPGVPAPANARAFIPDAFLQHPSIITR